MTLHGTYTGVVDRVVDGETAVILLESDDEVSEQLDLPVDRLPEPARADGGVLSVTLADGEVVSMDYEAEATRGRRESAREKLDRLSERLSDQ